MRRRAAVLALAALLASGLAASAETRLDGAVATPLLVTPALLAALPSAALDIRFETSKGVESGHYRGVLLWTLVEKAGLLPLLGRNGDVRRMLLVTGADGYQAALALGEIDPHYEGKAVLLAPDGDRLRLLVPGDRHGGRSVRDVVRIEVR